MQRAGCIAYPRPDRRAGGSCDSLSHLFAEAIYRGLSRERCHSPKKPSRYASSSNDFVDLRQAAVQRGDA